VRVAGLASSHAAASFGRALAGRALGDAPSRRASRPLAQEEAQEHTTKAVLLAGAPSPSLGEATDGS